MQHFRRSIFSQKVNTSLGFLCPGHSHGPPTPPTTPKTEVHVANKHDGQRHSDGSNGPAAPSNRQNIDFSHVDISELSTDVIGTMDGFDVREFDQYLPPSGLGSTAAPQPGGSSPSGSFALPKAHFQSHSIPTWTPKGGAASGTRAPSSGREPRGHEDIGPKPQVKTEQLSPGHHSGSCTSTPPHPPPEYPSLGSTAGPPCVSSSPSAVQSDYTDLQSSGFYGAISGYSSHLYQYPYFHSSRRPYTAPLINSLALAPPPRSPPSGWEQPIYTTLGRP